MHSKPGREDMAAMRELYPTVDPDEFKVSPHVRGVHGESRIGDVVLFFDEHGHRSVGQLCVNIRVSVMEWSVIEKWTFVATMPDVAYLHNYRVEFVAMQVPTENVSASLTVRPPTGTGRHCFVIIPKGI